MLKPPLNDFLLAEVNTDRLLNVPVFLHTNEGHQRGVHVICKARACSQHRSLAYDNLEEGDGDLADVRATREDFVGATTEVTRLDSAVCQL
jgi:hypothetical protein